MKERVLWPEVPDGPVDVQEGAKVWKEHVVTGLRSPQQRDGEMARTCKELRKVTEQNGADIIAADFNTSASCERGQAKVSSIEEAWRETLLVPPPDLVAMWRPLQTGALLGLEVCETKKSCR